MSAPSRRHPRSGCPRKADLTLCGFIAGSFVSGSGGETQAAIEWLLTTEPWVQSRFVERPTTAHLAAGPGGSEGRLSTPPN
jgi:hypothetical protein